MECGVSAPMGSYDVVQSVQGGPRGVRRPFLWLCTATGYQPGYQTILVGVPMVGPQRQDREAEKAMPVSQALQLAAPSAWPLHLLTAQAITPTMG